tara:strand:- start:2445 stop:2549 length:105 start_codon:yes stop_codon:yes gene_type:complete
MLKLDPQQNRIVPLKVVNQPLKKEFFTADEVING